MSDLGIFGCQFMERSGLISKLDQNVGNEVSTY